jgi:hypothetical protein
MFANPFAMKAFNPPDIAAVPFWSRQASPLLGSAVEAPAGGLWPHLRLVPPPPKPWWMYGIKPHMTGTFWD